MTRSQLLAIGGRSGVGKSTVAFAAHDLLSGRGVKHAVIEGDALDLAYPAPRDHGMAERNLQAVWANYRSEDYRRLIYTNSVSVLEVDKLAVAMGDDPTVTAVLLEARDDSIEERLRQREWGDSLKAHIERSKRISAFLESKAPGSVHRISTDGKSTSDIASAILGLLDW